MGRTRKKSGSRQIPNCIWSCLQKNTFPHILKWTSVEREFSILFKHKKSRDWDENDLGFFKKLDKLSDTKGVKYSNQPDQDQACKRRCRANLQKLCRDGVLKFVKEVCIGKCTKIKYYKFLEVPCQNEINKELPLVSNAMSFTQNMCEKGFEGNGLIVENNCENSNVSSVDFDTFLQDNTGSKFENQIYYQRGDSTNSNLSNLVPCCSYIQNDINLEFKENHFDDLGDSLYLNSSSSGSSSPEIVEIEKEERSSPEIIEIAKEERSSPEVIEIGDEEQETSSWNLPSTSSQQQYGHRLSMKKKRAMIFQDSDSHDNKIVDEESGVEEDEDANNDEGDEYHGVSKELYETTANDNNGVKGYNCFDDSRYFYETSNDQNLIKGDACIGTNLFPEEVIDFSLTGMEENVDINELIKMTIGDLPINEDTSGSNVVLRDDTQTLWSNVFQK